MKVGIIGCGVIGGALLRACVAKGIEVFPYDPSKEGMKDFKVILGTDLVFLCLPTPTKDGVQNVDAITSTLAWLNTQGYQNPIVIRSTVLPGSTAEFQYNYPTLNLAHCPEFLTAATPLEDLIKQTVVLIGAPDKETRQAVTAFWRYFDKKTPIETFYDTTETEMAKYIHNCFLATKVSFMNDMYELCNSMECKYEEALRGALAVGQIGKGHTAVPGPDGEQGYGGMCFPKDMNALQDFAVKQGLKVETLIGAVKGNWRRRSKPEDR
jgi:UDPglucose 6-dehydrogenase